MILSNELALGALDTQRTFRVKYFLQNKNDPKWLCVILEALPMNWFLISIYANF